MLKFLLSLSIFSILKGAILILIAVILTRIILKRISPIDVEYRDIPEDDTEKQALPNHINNAAEKEKPS